MLGYQPDDDWSKPETANERTGEKRLSWGWALTAAAVGFPVAIVVGQIATVGAAEIAGVMAAAVLLCAGAFWDLREEPWFAPLISVWVLVHLAALVFAVIPMQLQGSKLLLLLMYPEYLAFVGLVWLAGRLWGRASQN